MLDGARFILEQPTGVETQHILWPGQQYSIRQGSAYKVRPTADGSVAHSRRDSRRASQLHEPGRKPSKPCKSPIDPQGVHVITRQQDRRRKACSARQPLEDNQQGPASHRKAIQLSRKQTNEPSVATTILQQSVQVQNGPAVESQLLEFCRKLIAQAQQGNHNMSQLSRLQSMQTIQQDLPAPPILESVVITEAVTQLQTLLHMWSLYCNSSKMTAVSTPQRPPETVCNKQLTSTNVESTSESTQIQALVKQAGLLLCSSIFNAAAASPWTDLPSCQQVITATHALGVLHIYQPTIISDCERRVVACWQAYKSSCELSHVEPPFTTRNVSQLLAAWAKLGHHPATHTLVAVLESSTYSMRAAITTANTLQSPQRINAGLGKQQASHASLASAEDVKSRTKSREARTSTVDKQGTVRLQATARALVDLAEAVAQLMPGCLTTPLLYENKQPASEKTLVSRSRKVPRSKPMSAGAAGGTIHASTRLPPHVINAAALLLPPGIPLPAAVPVQPIITATPGTTEQPLQAITSADPLLTLWSNQQSVSVMSNPRTILGETSTDQVLTEHLHSNESLLGSIFSDWQTAFQECMVLHVVALNASNTGSLLDACSKLHMQLSDSSWVALSSSASRAVQSVYKDKQSIEARSKAQDMVACILESLAWLHVRSNETASLAANASWPDCAPPSKLPLPLKQVIAAGMAEERISGTDHRTLAPFIWAAVVLLGLQGWEELQDTHHAKVVSANHEQSKMPQKQASDQRSRSASSKQCTRVHQQQQPHHDSSYTHHPIQNSRLPGEWEQVAFEQLHGQLPFMTSRHLAQAIHAAGLLGVRPYKAWMYTFSHQVQKHKTSFDKESCLMMVWSLAVLHGPGLKPDQPTTSALVAALSQHVPCMTIPEMQVVVASLRKIYQRLRGHSLQMLVHDLEHRIRILNA